MSAPVLFLDVDGVLNSRSYYLRLWIETGLCATLWAIDPQAMRRLNGVVRETGCLVTVSSTWRRQARCRELLRAHGFRGTFSTDWRTDWMVLDPSQRERTRGHEIADWLSRNPTPRYAIVDDDGDMLDEQRGRFVQTRNEHGLTDECARRLIEILSTDSLTRSA